MLTDIFGKIFKGERIMRIVIEGLILSLLLYLTCAIWIRNGAVNMVFLYSKEVQERVISKGMTTAEKIRKSGNLFKTFGLIFYFGYAMICVYAINGTRGFLPSFIELVAILMIMGVFDRIFIDTIWVGHTKAWIIPGTEDLMPYITVKNHITKWVMTLIGYPLVSAILCGIMALILK